MRHPARSLVCIAALLVVPSVVPAQNAPGDMLGAAANAANGLLGNAPASSGSNRGRSRRGRPATGSTPLSLSSPRALLTLTADGYMQLPLQTFQNLRGVRPPPYDWQSHGCSFGEISGPFREAFDRACARQEFGYRNYGAGGLALDTTEGRRTRIDDRLRDDLQGICHGQHQGLLETPCLIAAQTVYAGARAAGRNWFFQGPQARPPTVPTPGIAGFDRGANAGPIPGLPIPGLPSQPTGNSIPLPIPLPH